MIDRIDHELARLRTASNLRTYRQELLASNIANADTPHYKARDIDFRSAFEDALAGRAAGDLAAARTSPGHLAQQTPDSFASRALYRTEFQSSVDGNTVNMDVERSALAENSVQLEAAMTFIREHLRVLQMAIQGQ